MIIKREINDFDSLKDELFPEGEDLTSLNDFIRFDSDYIFETLGISEEDED